MNAKDREIALERHKKYLLEEGRLERWNHVRHRAGKPDLTLEQAARFLLDPSNHRDVKEYLDE
jgi:hypothetical protein